MKRSSCCLSPALGAQLTKKAEVELPEEVLEGPEVELPEKEEKAEVELSLEKQVIALRASRMNIPALKRLLTSRGKVATGNKGDLVDRVVALIANKDEVFDPAKPPVVRARCQQGRGFRPGSEVPEEEALETEQEVLDGPEVPEEEGAGDRGRDAEGSRGA